MAVSVSVLQRGIDPAWNKWDALIWAQAAGDVEMYALIKAVIAHESNWVETAHNPSDPSAGLMQILYGSRGPYPMMTKEQLMDGATNIILGSRFLLGLVHRNGIEKGVSAYNQGEAGMLRRGIINPEYVDSVLNAWGWYLENPGEAVATYAEDGSGWGETVYEPDFTQTTEYGDEYPDILDDPMYQVGAGSGLVLAAGLAAFLFLWRRV